MPIVKCSYCGSDVKKQNWMLKKFKKFYCNLKCQSLGNRKRIKLVCLQCGKEHEKDKGHIRKRTFCSRKCFIINMTGRLPDNFKESIRSFKGDEAKYSAKHIWARKYLGKPKKCEKCGTTEDRMYHWHNISGEYKREKEDWQRLCVPCHSRTIG